MRAISLAVATALLLTPALPATAQEVDRTQIARIVDEGTRDSEVMRIAQYLTDVIGPRLTNSPGMRQAEDWTAAKFREWGLSNVHKEGFEFGRGWSAQSWNARMVSPRIDQLTVMPITWTPGTNGTVRGPVVRVSLSSASDFERWKGKLAGKIVLLDEAEPAEAPTSVPFRRWTDEDFAKYSEYSLPTYSNGGGSGAWMTLGQQRDAFLKEEGVLATVSMSGRDGDIVHGSGYSFLLENAPQVPGFEMSAEDYRRLARLLEIGATPEIELESSVTFDDSNTTAYNVIADIPGTDRNAGYVMAGAHLDSWAAGDGAADNAAGSAMVMEAARIIKSLNIRTRRTIRFALWNGEEQGLLGSMAYVEKHIASRPVDPDASGIARYMGWNRAWPITPGPDHGKLAAYFNIDNGSGKIRGIYAQGNPAVMPIFEEWLKPFASLGATQVAMRSTGGTDHVFFDAVGIPAFQFIQDPLDYGSRLHHTNLDTFDHLQADDMRQGAIILAAFLIQAANADEPLPRMPIPAKPLDSSGYYPWAGQTEGN
ncbi:M20/M25/M40 family metallo-hydrolase [Stakelama tenebrarum]|uniref:Carboxypeptidase Q n=1 Tax=Stakelama tenebrarum TaxID=2711215 RepID=A0A6G6Y3M9_9SPHN|nr:M20/M25/M40 family metallo-hydrolase [Sphingosinithalassobacter tenebrarum]QIG79417.1 M20/M25/M40 family metallo-hydrolase [Sphingosinithalassobacter tenebrarum]